MQGEKRNDFLLVGNLNLFDIKDHKKTSPAADDRDGDWLGQRVKAAKKGLLDQGLEQPE